MLPSTSPGYHIPVVLDAVPLCLSLQALMWNETHPSYSPSFYNRRAHISSVLSLWQRTFLTVLLSCGADGLSQPYSPV